MLRGELKAPSGDSCGTSRRSAEYGEGLDVSLFLRGIGAPRREWGSRVVRRQLLATEGVVGFSMLAKPLRKHYATLSVWRDESALEAFAQAHPHDRLMTDLVPGDGHDEVRSVDDLGRRWTSVVERRVHASAVESFARGHRHRAGPGV
jgi:hypothetical protein